MALETLSPHFFYRTLLHPFLYVIDFKRPLGFGEAQHPAFTENCLSWGLPWRNPRWPDIYRGPANRLPKLGEPL